MRFRNLQENTERKKDRQHENYIDYSRKNQREISAGCDRRVFEALSRYAKLEIIEVADEKTPDSASETVETNIKNKEAERLLKYIRDDAYLITLEIKGKQLTSEELAQKIDTLGVQGTSHIIFAIGGSLGLGEEVLKRSNYALSFRK